MQSRPVPWYEQYFTSDYWAYADAEYSAERTKAEVTYLAEILTRQAPGKRVLDLGCGCGRHAIGLARLGFDVTGVDVSEYALRRAKDAAGLAGVQIRLHRADLLGTGDWGIRQADAVVCVQAFGWGTDADQLRLLRRVRLLLPPDGVLVLDHSSILGITRIYQPRAHAEIGGASFEFVRSYDPVTGRSGGEVRIRRADGTAAALPDDVRLYTPAEVGALLRRAGFAVSAADADFTAGAPVTLATRYVQFVAIQAPVAESALAGHRDPVPPEGIDLRWAPDEAEFVTGPIAAAWAQISQEAPPVADRARRYDLADPYGGGRAAPVLAAHLCWPAGATVAADRVSTGAGVTGLLHGLARLAGGGIVLAGPAGHPQLTEAAVADGSQIAVVPMTEPAAVLAAVDEHRPAMTIIDQPGLVGRLWPTTAIAELAARTAEAGGGTLVVDETCGGYLPPGTSAAALTDDIPGLIVLRSMSKGYCCGGLRIGFAIASPDLADQVRTVLPPLAASALAFDIALALLGQPDPLAALRDRIAEVKPQVAALLADAGLTAIETDPHVPWLVFAADPVTRAAFAARRLVTKEAPVLNSSGRRSALLRLAVPLSSERLSAVRAALGGSRQAPR
jgi:histidinol-phosphate/aromatic aminotransferase/cobyric acid decarboxylase-like protein/SAM-dependent methyltransferase